MKLRLAFGSRPDLVGRPLEAVEDSLRRLRVMAAIALAVAAIGSRDLSSPFGRSASIGLAVALAAVLLVSNAVSLNSLQRHDATRAVWFQLAADSIVTTGAIWLFNPGPDSYAWVILAFPVLEGAMRYRVVGAISVWLAIAAALLARLIYQWRPGEGLSAISSLAGPLVMPLAVGLPAAYLADHLVREVALAAKGRQAADRRARILAVLAVAGQDLVSDDPGVVCQTAADAAVELGMVWADIVTPAQHGRGWRRLASAGNAEYNPGRPDADFKSALATTTSPKTRVLGQSMVVGVLHPAPVVLRTVHHATPTPIEMQALDALCLAAQRALEAAHRSLVLRRARERLHYEATHDNLTGLMNRAGLLSELSDRIARLRDGGSPTVVLLLDLNGFKEVNDTMGHEAGDEVLTVVARRLEKLVPPGGVAARLGGDEFVVVYESKPEDDPVAVATRLRRGLLDPIRTAVGMAQVGAAVGSAVAADPDSIPAELLKYADRAMYDDKESSRWLGRALR